MEDLLVRVIGTVYLPRARDEVQKTLIRALFRWIYQVILLLRVTLFRA